jgi:hypothetical protein
MIQVSNDRIDTLVKMIKLSKDDQTRHLNYLAKGPIEVRLGLFEKQRELFYPLSQKYKDHMSPSDISYGALILAIGVTRAIEKKLTKNSFETLSIDEIRDLSSMRAVTFKHKMTNASHKQEKLMGYWAIVRTLRLEHGYSYERVSLFLKKKHRFSVAPSTIMKKWKEIETPNTSENGL